VKALFLAVLVLVTMSATATADSIEAGDRVRVIDRRGKVGAVGTVTSIDSGGPSLYIDDGESTMELHLQPNDKLEKSLGMKRNTAKGALVGGSIGLALGLGVVLGVASSEGGSDFFGSGIIAATGAAITGLGVGLGALIGAATKTECWKMVPLEELTIGFTWSGDAPKLGVTMTF
jgi:hypothetical protein